MARPPLALKAGASLIPWENVDFVDAAGLEHGSVIIGTKSGGAHMAYGLDAVEAVMLMKPSATEGKRGLRWRSGAWAWHNIGGHVGTQLLAWLGCKRWAVRWHDYTVPKPVGFKERGGD